MSTIAEVSSRYWRWGEPAPRETSRFDSVEVSDQARWLHELAQLPPSRLRHVERVRHAIAQGVYETEDKIDTAIDRLAHDLSTAR